MAEEKVSLAQKYLSKEVWDLSCKRTSHGTTFLDCISSAIENPKSNVGIYAPGIFNPNFSKFLNLSQSYKLFKLNKDTEVYDLFSDLFHPAIAEYHKVDVETLKSVHDLGDPANLEELSTEYAENIVSTRVRVGRTVKGYPMASKLTREKRVELEGKIKDSLMTLEGDLAGTYKSLNEMSHEEKQELIDEHLLFNDADDA